MRDAFAGPEAQAHLQALMKIVGEKEDSPQSPKPSSHESFSVMDHSVFVGHLSLPVKQVVAEPTCLNPTPCRKRQAARTKASPSLQATPSLHADNEVQVEVKEQQRTEEKSVNDITLKADSPKEDVTSRFTLGSTQPLETTVLSTLQGEDMFWAEVKEQQRTEEKSAHTIMFEADPPKNGIARWITTDYVQPVETTDEQTRKPEQPPTQPNASQVEGKRKRRILDLVKDRKNDVSANIDNDTPRRKKRRRRD
jgi:hypothetical protein